MYSKPNKMDAKDINKALYIFKKVSMLKFGREYKIQRNDKYCNIKLKPFFMLSAIQSIQLG